MDKDMQRSDNPFMQLMLEIVIAYEFDLKFDHWQDSAQIKLLNAMRRQRAIDDLVGFLANLPRVRWGMGGARMCPTGLNNSSLALRNDAQLC